MAAHSGDRLVSQAGEEGLVACLRCTTVWPREASHCGVCGRGLRPRKLHSVQASVALLITAVVCYIPANVLPIMHTTQLGQSTANTILGGVLVLWDIGAYPTALVIFIASVIIPVAKIMALAWLNWSVVRAETLPADRHHVLFRVVETIGSWSMVDVFVVTLLVALVRFTGLLSITPGPAALAFCGLVVFTMLAALAFDPRLLWDKAPR